MVVTGMFLKRWQWGWHLVRCRLIWDGDGDWDARDDQGWCRSADSGRATAAWVPLSECISRRVSSGGPRHQGPAEPCAHPSIPLATCYPGHLWSPGLPQLTSLFMSPLVPLPACHGPAFSLVSDHAMRLRLGHWHIFHHQPQTTSETLHSTFLTSIINKTWKNIPCPQKKIYFWTSPEATSGAVTCTRISDLTICYARSYQSLNPECGFPVRLYFTK